MKAMRLIDAEALRGELLAEIGECLDNKTGQGRRFGLEAALRTLANAPTIDVPQRLTRDGVLAAVKAIEGAGGKAVVSTSIPTTQWERKS